MVRKDTVVEALRNFLSHREDVTLAYLFGSAAMRDRSMHDVDVAVLPENGVKDGVGLLGDLVIGIAKALGISEDRVDIVDITQADLDLRFKILTEGVRLLDRGGREKELKRELSERYPEARLLKEINVREWLRSTDPSGIDPLLLKRRLDIMRDEASFLKGEVLSKSLEEVSSSRVMKRLLERSVHVIVEAMLDACRHVVSAKGWGPAETYGEYLDLMRERNALSRDVAASMRRYVAWRNILAHRYIDVDHGRLYRDAKDLAVLAKEFERQIARFLERETE
ncbi:MAG: HepT-like ribonuclease domain-containing protein [Candidatus Bathyarchaeia archaeon]